MPNSGTDQPGEEIKIETDPLPNFRPHETLGLLERTCAGCNGLTQLVTRLRQLVIMAVVFSRL
jgi:hypothetical protein